MRPVTTLFAAAVGGLIALAQPALADQKSPETVACLAEAVYFEARGTSDRSLAAVAHVVLNRAEHDEFPDTPCAVVNEECQFSYQCDGRPERMAHAGDRDAAFRTARRVLAGEAPDPTDGALFFHASRIAPGWFATLDRTREIGGHVFYR